MKLVIYKENQLSFNTALLNSVLSDFTGVKTRVLFRILMGLNGDGKCVTNIMNVMSDLDISKQTVNGTINIMKKSQYDGAFIFKNINVTPTTITFEIADTGEKCLEKNVVEKANCKRTLDYFCEKFIEKYDKDIKGNFGLYMSKFRDIVTVTHTQEELYAIIDIAFEEYDTRWKSEQYPVITPISFTSFIFGECCFIYKKRNEGKFNTYTSPTTYNNNSL